MDRGFASRLRILKLLEEKDKHFILRVKNNMTLEMLENGRCKLIRDKLRSCILCQLGNYKMLQTLKVLASSSFEGFTPAPQSPHSLNDLRNLE